MPNLQPLITFGYWFNSLGAPFVGWAFIVVGVVIGLMFIEGIVVKYLSHRERCNPPLHRVLSRWSNAALAISVVGAVFYFFTYEQLPYVSARFWWLLLIAGGVWWKIAIIIDIRTRYRAEKAAFAERMAKEKYLPK
jgi:hypothetical protein